ncbi:MAG TPA: hypothetical protein VE033_14765 [Acetobacteraceae bacterium]|jgi:hypothetical protein|nr:hypothetical protein [Acetobacteraceae bacterium]
MRYLFALILLVAACAVPDPAADPAEALQGAAAQARAAVPGAEARAEPRAASAAPQRRTPAAPPTQAAQLVGHGPDAVTALFGEPRLRRPEGQAEVWHYTATGCHLDLFFYREGGTLRVAFAQARAMGTAQRPEAACLRDMARLPGARARLDRPGGA